MKLLSNHGQWKLLIDLAKNRGLLGDALDFMTSCGQKALTQGPLSAFPVDTIPTGTYPLLVTVLQRNKDLIFILLPPLSTHNRVCENSSSRNAT